MTNQTVTAATDPAPHRRKVSVPALFFGLAAAPLAWSAQMIAAYALSSHTCFPHDMPRATPLFPETRPIVIAINLAAIVFSVLGGAIAYRNWRVTREAGEGQSPHLVEVGEGRTHFLALSGILASVGFLVATIFVSFAILLVPLCRP